jgi:uncharacterized OB-fold protein
MAKPVPVPDETTAFYWQAAQEGRLEVQRCPRCGSWWFPPVIACAACQSEQLVATAVTGRGRVYSFTVVRQAFDRAFTGDLPYVVALVELEEDPSVRILSNIVNTSPDVITVGMPVEVAFEDRDGFALPVFQPC